MKGGGERKYITNHEIAFFFFLIAVMYYEAKEGGDGCDALVVRNDLYMSICIRVSSNATEN